MKVLVACEYSGVTRRAFQALGHTVWSADFEPAEDGSEWHYQGDCFDLIEGWEPVMFQAFCDPDGDDWCQVRDCDPSVCDCVGPTEEEVEYKESASGLLLGRREGWKPFDLMIAHPPCTYLSVSGLHWNKRGVMVDGRPRAELTEEALEFVQRLMDAPIERICIENPVSCISSRIRKPDQIIQPWQFGEDASKATCLWLKGLPRLVPTQTVEGRLVDGKRRWANQTDSGQNKLAPSKDRWKDRSRTYPGIAKAWAEQWGGFL